MGRTAGKVEDLEGQLAALTSAAVRLHSRHYGSATNQAAKSRDTSAIPPSLFSEIQLAKEIEADRLKFTGQPKFDPSPLLEPSTRQLYDDPLEVAVDPQESQEVPPHVQVRGSRVEVMKLFKALDRTGRLALFAPHQVRLDHRAGLFALMKNAESDRLIMDSRPANLLEPQVTRWTQTMAAINPLLDLVLAPGNILLAAGEDLVNYYYFYQVSSSRAARNAIAFQLSESEAQQFSCFSSVGPGESFYVPALATMAMGDVNAVEYTVRKHI